MNQSIFSPRLLIGWIGAAIATFAISLYFMGRQQEPGAEAVGPSTFSTSAIGHAGIADVLQRLRIPVVKSRSESLAQIGANGVLVIAEPVFNLQSERTIKVLLDAKAILLVLPKWRGAASEANPGWVRAVAEKPVGAPQWALDLVVPGGKVMRAETPPQFTTNAPRLTPVAETPVQLMQSDGLRPLIAGTDGMLVGEIVEKNRRVVVLADPDIIANHGLSHPDNAALAVRLIARLRGTGGAVVFDETVHGYTAQPANPMALMLRFPFVMVTAQGLLAIALLLWATMARFGAPQSAPPPLSAGRQGLLQNVAKLITFAGHQQVMVRRYVQETIREAARKLHAPRGLSGEALAAWLKRVGEARGVSVDAESVLVNVEMLGDARRRDLSPLVRIARDIHRWKREIVDGRSGHPRHH